MKFWTEYDAATGLLTGDTGFGTYAGSRSFIEGTYSREQFRVDLQTGEVVPYTPPPPPPPTTEQLQAALTQAVQNHLDATARSHGYDGIMSLCTYATSSVPKFQAEGQAGVVWRDSVWLYCFGQLQAALTGQRAVPTAEELIAELPAISWPA